MGKWYDKFITKPKQLKQQPSFIRSLIAGGLYKMSDLRADSSLADIKTQIDTMRALARDSQISTALSYYATDATTTNSSGQIIWATPVDDDHKDVADIINAKLKQWKVNTYARDHILELATIGNLYIPTSLMYKDDPGSTRRTNIKVAIDNNTIPDEEFEIIPSYNVPPEDIIHLWEHGVPQGYMYKPTKENSNTCVRYPESAIIHFSLGGLLGRYSISAKDSDGVEHDFDIQFAQPLMERAVQPTQTLGLLEDAMLLSSLSRVVKFVNVECDNAEEEEISGILQQIKDAIEQQLSLNTASGDAQSFVNPQSPNNLIYLPRVNGQDAISITDLNMAESSETDNKLLEYYQNKKLSVLGVPKEAMNFSSAEGLGGAGQVMSQRSALYANALSRLETAYISGWTDAFNKYFQARNMSGFVDQFELHMNPIITEMSQIQFDKRDSAIGQAQTIVDVMRSLGITDESSYQKVLTELLGEALPTTSAEVAGWSMKVTPSTDDSDMGGGF